MHALTQCADSAGDIDGGENENEVDFDSVVMTDSMIAICNGR